MSSPYIGEIRIFAGNFAPAGWAFCDGAPVPISENETLFNLIGTIYGGDGQNSFDLPNLGGRVPLHAGQGPGITQSYLIGQTGGVEQVTLTTAQMPAHTHQMLASGNVASSAVPTGNVIGRSASIKAFINVAPQGQLSPQAIQPQGGNQPHENMQPYTVINYIISLFGIFPSQN